VPFCVENKKLRIERRVQLCGSVFAPDPYEAFHAVDEEGPRPKDPNNYKYRLLDAPGDMKEWLDEAVMLQFHGMPHGSFQLVFDGPPGVLQQIWDVSVERVHITPSNF
jgi:hypothetical protein